MKAGIYLVAMVVLLAGFGMVYAQGEGAATGTAATAHVAANINSGLYAIAAALAIGLAAIGAGFGIAGTGSAAIGSIAEDSKNATWGLIFVALAEGIALYGLIISFILITKI
ncbi:MAG TPA: ATPase [Euryarchaeota archaeon]|nr:V-type ATP synthase subunit K [archaeon BMS3Bbin15]HDL15828.1 ATPase [Euryarchaeota archaeon]